MTTRSLRLAKDLTLPLDAVTQTIAILAKRRAGKSYAMRRLTEQLLKAWPAAVQNDDLATQANYVPNTGGYNNPRGRLRSLGLIEYPKPGQVRARDLLFLEN